MEEEGCTGRMTIREGGDGGVWPGGRTEQEQARGMRWRRGRKMREAGREAGRCVDGGLAGAWVREGGGWVWV